MSTLRLPKHWAWATTFAVCLSRFLVPGGRIGLDHDVDLRTVHAMQHGAGFWDAMDQALREIYGPASTVRAFRMPTVFLVWRVLPEWSWWPLYVAMAAGCGWLAMRLSGRQWAMPAVAALLVINGRGSDFSQFLIVEPWAVPAILGSLLAYRRERWGLAAALALLAGVIREQAAVLLLLGLVIAILRHQPWRAWAVGVVVWIVAFGLHVAAVAPHLVAEGEETNLLGTSHGLGSVLGMAGFGLPVPYVAAVVLYALAVRSLRHDAMAPLVAGFLAMPLVGFFVDRRYWGLLTVPVLLSVVDLVPRRRRTPAEEPTKVNAG